MTTISISGQGLTLTCSVADRELLQSFMSNPDGDIFADFHDNCAKSVVVQGVDAGNCRVLVDGEPWNEREGLSELMIDFEVHSFPMTRIIDVDPDHYLLITTEREEGDIFSMEIENFEDSKLIIERKMFELPSGEEVVVVSAIYDGERLAYGSPDVISRDNSLFDDEENELT